MTQLFHFWVFEISPESIQPCAMKNRDIYWKQFKIQETLYIGQWNLSPLQSRPWELTQFSQLPSAAPTVLHRFPFTGDFSFGKSQKLQGTKWCWITWVIWCFANKLCMRWDAGEGVLLWWSCQSPVAQTCSLLNHLKFPQRNFQA